MIARQRSPPHQDQEPPNKGICERFHRTVLDEFYRVAFRKKICRTIDELQTDLDAWITEYNGQRPHQGRWCFGKTPCRPFLTRYHWQRKNSGGMTTGDSHIGSHSQHRLSDQVSANTHQDLQHGLRNGSQEVALTALLQQLTKCHSVIGSTVALG